MGNTERRDVHATQQYEEYLRLATTAPKIPLDDPRVIEYQRRLRANHNEPMPLHDQYGGNFYLLFIELQRKINKEGDSERLYTYIPQAEQLGKPWQSFLTNNTPVIEAVFQAFEERKTYDNLRAYEKQLMRSQQWERGDELEAAIQHPFGFEAIGMAAWDRINATLEHAAEKMREAGIQPEQFFL